MSGRWKVLVVVVMLVGVSSMGAFSHERTVGTQITDNAAKSLWGGDCAMLDKEAQGACTTKQANSCGPIWCVTAYVPTSAARPLACATAVPTLARSFIRARVPPLSSHNVRGRAANATVLQLPMPER